MRTALLLALASIVALLVGSLSVIEWASPDDSSAADDALATAVVDSSVATAEPTAGGATAALAPADSTAQPAVAPPVEVSSANTTTRLSPAGVSRASQPGLNPKQHLARIAFRHEIANGLAALRQRVAPCGVSDLTFTLDLETVAGGIRVLDASVTSGAPPEDRRASCASAAARDMVMPAPSAQPGQHWQISFSPGNA